MNLFPNENKRRIFEPHSDMLINWLFELLFYHRITSID